MSELEKKGWKIYKTSKINELKIICNNMLTEFKKFGIKADTIDELREKVSELEEAELNNIKSNFNINCGTLIAKIYSETIKSIAGNNIFLQRKPHLQINSPNKIKTVTPPHADIIFGHSPGTFTIWTPLHDVNDSSGLFCVDLDKSISLMISEEKFGDQFSEKLFNRDVYKPLKVKFGESIIFNSLVVHGAWLNTSSLARISLDTRFQNINKKLFEKNIDYFEIYEFN